MRAFAAPRPDHRRPGAADRAVGVPPQHAGRWREGQPGALAYNPLRRARAPCQSPAGAGGMPMEAFDACSDSDLTALEWVTLEYYIHQVNPENGLVADKTATGAPASI